jgi:hypothetical protein
VKLALVLGHAATYPAPGSGHRAQPSRKCSAAAALGGVLCRAALDDARVPPGERDDVGLYLGVCHGRTELVERAVRISDELGLMDFCDPVAFVNSVASAVTGHSARAAELGGCSFVVNTGVLSGIDAVGLASLGIGGSGAGIVLAGGVESAPSRGASHPSKLKDTPVHGTGGAVLALAVGSAGTVRAGALGEEAVCVRAYRTGREDPAECFASALHGARARAEDLAFVAGCGSFAREVLERFGSRADWFQTREALGYLGGAEGAIACSVAARSLARRHGQGRCAAVVGVSPSGACSCIIFGPDPGPHPEVAAHG